MVGGVSPGDFGGLGSWWIVGESQVDADASTARHDCTRLIQVVVGVLLGLGFMDACGTFVPKTQAVCLAFLLLSSDALRLRAMRALLFPSVPGGMGIASFALDTS